MSMDMFDNVLDNVDENYPFHTFSQTQFGSIGNCEHMCDFPRDNIHMVQKKNYSFFFHYGKFN